MAKLGSMQFRGGGKTSLCHRKLQADAAILHENTQNAPQVKNIYFLNLQILDDVGLNVLRWADILGTNTDISLCKPFKFSKFSTSTPPPPLSLSVSLFFFSL